MYGRKALSKLLNNTREGSVLLTFIRNTKMFMVVLASLCIILILGRNNGMANKEFE